VQERIYPDGETLTRLGFAGTLGWAGVYISLAGLDRSCHIVPPPGEVVVSMRPVCVFAKGPGEEIERLRAGLRGRAAGGAGGDGAAVAAGVTGSLDRRATGLPPGSLQETS
jgi:hypothetical protein